MKKNALKKPKWKCFPIFSISHVKPEYNENLKVQKKHVQITYSWVVQRINACSPYIFCLQQFPIYKLSNKPQNHSKKICNSHIKLWFTHNFFHGKLLLLTEFNFSLSFSCNDTYKKNCVTLKISTQCKGHTLCPNVGVDITFIHMNMAMQVRLYYVAWEPHQPGFTFFELRICISR